MIRDLSEAYLVIRDFASDDDKLLIQDALIGAFLKSAGSPLASPISVTDITPTPMPGLERSDFEDMMKRVGYLDVDMGFAKWNLEDLEVQGRDERLLKMEALRKLLPAAAEAPIATVIAAPFENHDVSRCPRCATPGSDKGKYFVCANRECFRPNGKHTTWDSSNWQRIKSE